MSRSPLAYPLTRSIDGESGGAADLQTDIMRFMAILALCLVAIFALVQSLPMAPQAASAPADPSAPILHPDSEPVRAPETLPEPRLDLKLSSADRTAKKDPVTLTRPAWTPKYSEPGHAAASPDARTETAAGESPADAVPAEEAVELPVEASPPRPASDREGFTLRFESDLALTRLVASGLVGFYAIEPGRAQRMSVRESRISFWEASTPGEIHEMESATVPQPVIDALTQSGADASSVSFGVTLPSRLRAQLARLMNDYEGGALVIGADGNLQLEAGG